MRKKVVECKFYNLFSLFEKKMLKNQKRTVTIEIKKSRKSWGRDMSDTVKVLECLRAGQLDETLLDILCRWQRSFLSERTLCEFCQSV